ncbi:probable hexosyltransferase MUCI70 [Oryza glaberrima]|uniref:probable hexosyltransferase MUCI70 n=1 Tax=Oryza glaberrima TaxID=4538 RepID=UPI00224C39A7|nr:probable hexosyltransferase MUCI70 [Oryza glaberrima]
MGWVRMRVRSPPVMQSKLLCLSLLYLLTTLPLALYVSFSDPASAASRCLAFLPFRSSAPSSAASAALFEYPREYGEHKHAIPATRALCSDPAVFSDYKTVLEEINKLCRNLSASPYAKPALRYQNGRRNSFAGNLSTVERKSFFNHTDSAVEIPCGFFKEFPVRESDRLAMEKCNGVVVASAIFNDHDKIRQLKGLGSETLRTVCFFMFIDDATHRVLASHNILAGERGEAGTVGAWRVARLVAGAGGDHRLPYENPAMNGVIVKYLLHRLFPNARFSVWVDAKMQLTVDPLLLVHSFVAGKGADMAVSKHPFNLHTMEEAIATARWRKWGDVDAIRAQMETYCRNGLQPWSPIKLPYPSDVPDTAIIIRRHGLASDLFSCLLFNELEAFNPRDQLAFAYVRDQMSPKVIMNMFDVEVFEHIAVEYRHNLKRGNGGAGGKQGITRMASSGDIAGSSCERYLLKMWGETTE